MKERMAYSVEPPSDKGKPMRLVWIENDDLLNTAEYRPQPKIFNVDDFVFGGIENKLRLNRDISQGARVKMSENFLYKLRSTNDSFRWEIIIE